MKILLAVDGSPFTKKMLAYLVTHPELFGTHNAFTLLTVVEALPPRARAAVSAEVAQGYYTEEAAKVANPVVEFLARHQIQPEVLHQVGRAGDHIAQVATDGGFDLVMMGSHGHGTLKNLVLGSVATKVLANCGTPVLLIR